MKVTPLPSRRTGTVEHAPAPVLPFRAPCPSWCTVEDPHERHLRAIGVIGVRPTSGRLDVVTVMVQGDRRNAAVDLRILSQPGHHGALLDAEGLDKVLAALIEARQCITSRSTTVAP